MPSANATARRKPTDPRLQDWSVFWFASLEHARDRGDAAGIAEARRELARLGVEVIYRPRLLGEVTRGS